MWSPKRICFDIEYGNRLNTHRPSSHSDSHERPHLTHLRIDSDSSQEIPAPFLKRRLRRSNTVTSYDSATSKPHRQPGNDPGLDPLEINGGKADTLPYEECQITAVDFSTDEILVHDFSNAEFIEFLGKPQDTWVKCRWINVNGISSDVIQALGSHKNLHRLALEDLINTNNRTKADWYADHTYIRLPLQKLVHQHDEEESQSNTDNLRSVDSPSKKRERVSKFFHKFIPSKITGQHLEKDFRASKIAGMNHTRSCGAATRNTIGTQKVQFPKLRTIQEYHCGPNHERRLILQSLSPFMKKKLVVVAEQVSIFITADNTVISLFESSAEDVKLPIIPRLSTRGTSLRRSCDASMVAQAIVHAIIDLAIPVTTAYREVIGDLEFSQLTEPTIKHTTSLYIVTNEIIMMRNVLCSTANLISSLGVPKFFEGEGVRTSARAQTYLGDVEGHINLMIESLDQMRKSCENMIGMTFNTISANQNDSMKQLTIVSVLFLPLTFITEFFGMNFENFPATHHSESYFWCIAIPVVISTIILLMRDSLRRWLIKLLQGGCSKQKGRIGFRNSREAKRMSRDPYILPTTMKNTNEMRYLS